MRSSLSLFPFIGEETTAQRGQVICQRSHNRQVMELGFEPGLWGFGVFYNNAFSPAASRALSQPLANFSVAKDIVLHGTNRRIFVWFFFWIIPTTLDWPRNELRYLPWLLKDRERKSESRFYRWGNRARRVEGSALVPTAGEEWSWDSSPGKAHSLPHSQASVDALWQKRQACTNTQRAFQARKLPLWASSGQG